MKSCPAPLQDIPRPWPILPGFFGHLDDIVFLPGALKDFRTIGSAAGLTRYRGAAQALWQLHISVGTVPSEISNKKCGMLRRQNVVLLCRPAPRSIPTPTWWLCVRRCAMQRSREVALRGSTPLCMIDRSNLGILRRCHITLPCSRFRAARGPSHQSSGSPLPQCRQPRGRLPLPDCQYLSESIINEQADQYL